MDEPVLYVVHTADGGLYLGELGQRYRLRKRHYAFRSRYQAERVARNVEGALVVVYRPDDDNG